MKKNSIKKRKIREDCWSLDYAWIDWLHERLPVYLHDASKFIDMTYWTFEYNGVKYTEEEIVKRMIELVNNIYNYNCHFNSDYLTESYEKDYNELLDLWKLSIHALWW